VDCDGDDQYGSKDGGVLKWSRPSGGAEAADHWFFFEVDDHRLDSTVVGDCWWYQNVCQVNKQKGHQIHNQQQWSKERNYKGSYIGTNANLIWGQELLVFDGPMHKEELLDWLAEVEEILNELNTAEH